MNKKILLDTPHHERSPVAEYTLAKLVVNYELDEAVVELKGEGGQKFEITLTSIPNTTQDNAIIALVNNGVLAGTISG